MQTSSVLPQNKEEESKEDGNGECISHVMAVQCVDTLLHYVGHWDFAYNDIKTVKKSQAVVRRRLNKSQKASKH